ncbi:MAG: ADP-ribose pyrophosphatase, partial [Arenibacter sp.]|nr:ADP-ribose pyrophosphatase [Arenibacter sp.]
IGYTPSEIVRKEIEEETGLVTKVDRLLAVYDKRCHRHPPQPFYVYKLVFLCTIKNGNLRWGFDMEGAAFFDIDNLPELSEDRILKSQIKQLYKLALDETPKVYFD